MGKGGLPTDITLEQVEKVRSCTGVSYQDAKDALERSGGSVLDAVILLEQEGKSRPAGGSYSTRTGSAAPPPWSESRPRITWSGAWSALRSIARNCLAISLEVWKGGRMTCLVPLIAALILILVTPYTILALALVGLCMGYRVHISGQGTEGWGEKLNQAADQVADTVNDAVSQLRRGKRGKKG